MKWSESALKRARNKYVSILMGASAVTEEYAKTALYWAGGTHLLPDHFDIYPILTYVGEPGSGKTAEMSQVLELSKDAKLISGESKASIREELLVSKPPISMLEKIIARASALGNMETVERMQKAMVEPAGAIITAGIDEADGVDEKTLIRRYSKKSSKIAFNRSLGEGAWELVTANIFGATTATMRGPFRDAATGSRSIFINTILKPNPGKHHITQNIDLQELNNIVLSMPVDKDLFGRGRIRDNYAPLIHVATCFGDKEWIAGVEEKIKLGELKMKSLRAYEPKLAIVSIISTQVKEMRANHISSDYLNLKTIAFHLKDKYSARVKIPEISSICTELELKVSTTGNYPGIKLNDKNLRKLEQLKADLGLNENEEEDREDEA